ncbi:MAG: tRNA dihydrouridine synthase DusB [Bacteroidetes bacterium]|nr:tRNA dihydrouridine synthase DusB [Bacteroidota bacterium]
MVHIGPVILPHQPLLLAPMEDVSDPPFRAVCKDLGADLLFTEFISSEGLIRDATKSRQKLDIYERERPVGVQLFGGDSDVMVEAARIVTQTRPDILDINYGCPVKKVVCKGAGAAILKDPVFMEKLTRQVVQATDLPVTVKTRLGWDENNINVIEVALRLQDAGIKALSIHARTRAQLYKGQADWDWISRVTSHPDIEIPIFGNGDVDSPQTAVQRLQTSGVQGIMIGRAAIGYPWIFREIKHYRETGTLLAPPDIPERVRVCRLHFQASVEWKGERTAVNEMRRHYANYFKGVAHFKPWRTRLVEAPDAATVHALLDEIAATDFMMAHELPADAALDPALQATAERW